MRIDATKNFPHSLGTALLGSFTILDFASTQVQYKTHGVAPYGPTHLTRKIIHENLSDLMPDGSFRLDMSISTMRRAGE